MPHRRTDMANDVDNNQAIGFNSEGNLELRDLELLSLEVLPRYFKRSNVKSFIRQLHYHNFRAVRKL